MGPACHPPLHGYVTDALTQLQPIEMVRERHTDEDIHHGRLYIGREVWSCRLCHRMSDVWLFYCTRSVTILSSYYIGKLFFIL